MSASRRAHAASLVLGTLLVAAGCAHPPAPTFPIGIYDAPPSSFPALAAAGFDLVINPPGPDALDAAAEHGLRVVLFPPPLDAPNDLRTVRALDRHPAFFAWYLYDEPDLHDLSPRKVAELNRRLKRLSRKPTLLVLSSGSAAEKYAGITDLLAVDWYPVPWAPVGTVSREMRLARLGARAQPFYAIVQAFDWTEFQYLLKTETDLRAPVYAELRCMAYLALMQGARGLFFYTYHARGWDLEKHPELWHAVMDIAGEVRDRSTIFGERVLWWRTQSEYHGPPDLMYNEILESRISMALFRSGKQAAPKEEGYYLILANTTAQPVDFSFKLPFAERPDDFQIATWCATNGFRVDQSWLRKEYGPYEICILGPIRGKVAE